MSTTVLAAAGGSSSVSVCPAVLTQASAGCATPSFAPATNFDVGSFPQQVAVGDFNRDGKLDLVTANESTIDVSVLLGDGKGGFGDKTDFPAGIFPDTVTVADLNLDGNPDLVVVSDFDDVSVLLGDGAGGFSSPTNFPAENSVDEDGFPIAGTVGDFNLDGIPDIATALVQDKVSVLLGDGKGGFGKPTIFAVGLFPRSPIVGDFNLDGNPDLATANLGSNTVSVLLGDGKGGFGDKTDFPVGIQPNSVTVGDFNGDGKPDLATANGGPGNPPPGVISGNVSVLLGDGKGGFGDKTDFLAGNVPISVMVGDFNLDGNIDLASANVLSNDVSVLFGDGAGHLNAAVNFAVANLPDSVAVGDFNGDGELDIATSDANPGKVSVLLNTCPGAPNRCPQPAGFWKNNPAAWPVATLTLGGQSYTQAELLDLLNTPPRGDASLILSKQLIAAKLNLANGSDPAPISSTIADVNGLLSGFTGKLPLNVAASSTPGQAMTTDAGILESYNNGLLTPGCVP